MDSSADVLCYAYIKTPKIVFLITKSKTKKTKEEIFYANNGVNCDKV